MTRIVEQPLQDMRDKALTIGNKPNKKVMKGDTIRIIHGGMGYKEGAILKVNYAVYLPIGKDNEERLYIACDGGIVVPAGCCTIIKIAK